MGPGTTHSATQANNSFPEPKIHCVTSPVNTGYVSRFSRDIRIVYNLQPKPSPPQAPFSYEDHAS